MLTRKDVKWQWGQEQQQAFNELKGIFTMRPVLASPDLDKEFRIEADASNYAIKEVLSMKCSNELWKPVAFISKSLSDIESVTVVLWTSSHILYGLPLHQKGDVSKATC